MIDRAQGPIAAEMIKKSLLIAMTLGLALLAVGFVAYLGNRAPAVPPVSAVEAANPTKPYVVKLHAQWCPRCMVTTGVWSQIEDTYSGRVNLLVLDFTNQATSDVGRAEAHRLGLETFFEEHVGETGTVVVLDGRTRDVTASIHGSRDFSAYREAIDAALTVTASGR